MEPSSVRLCLTGDVMCGRGIDQILEHPGDPTIHEPWLTSATAYVELAEAHSGPIPRPVSPSYVWGHALDILEQVAPDAIIVNLETAITDRGRPWPGKGIQYRMDPANTAVLTAAGIEVATLANNHVLDWSVPGLAQTLDALSAAGIAVAGAGRTQAQAWTPAVVPHHTTGRIVVVAAGAASSGIPPEWEARNGHPGVALLPDLATRTVDHIAGVVDAAARPGDIVVFSVHWGPNWGYGIPTQQRRFAHQLIDRAGVHVVHGHSSHHPLGIEVHRGHLILHGAGDLLTDYEGIAGHEQYRGELGALHLPTIEAGTGKLRRLDLAPTKVERFQLTPPPREDIEWLARTLDEAGRPLGTTVRVGDDDRLVVAW